MQAEIKKKWHCWKLGISTLDEQRTTSSHILQAAAGLQEHQDQAIQLDYPEESGIHLSMDPLPASTQIHLHQHYPRAKKGKAYCYISAHKKVLNGLDTPAQEHCELDGVNEYSDSYC